MKRQQDGGIWDFCLYLLNNNLAAIQTNVPLWELWDLRRQLWNSPGVQDQQVRFEKGGPTQLADSPIVGQGTDLEIALSSCGLSSSAIWPRSCHQHYIQGTQEESLVPQIIGVWTSAPWPSSSPSQPWSRSPWRQAHQTLWLKILQQPYNFPHQKQNKTGNYVRWKC